MSAQRTPVSADDLELLSRSARDFCTRALPRARLRSLREAAQSYDHTAWSEMVALGWTDIALPPARGGTGLGDGGVARLARELGRVLSPEPFLETAVAAASLLAAADADELHLNALRDGKCVYTLPLGANAWAASGLVAARRDGETSVLDGTLCSLAIVDQADTVLVPARLDGTMALFAIPTAACPLNIYRLADGSFAGDIRFDAARYPLGQTLVAADVTAAVPATLALAGLGASAYLLGLAEALLEMTLEHVRTRHQFGRAIGSFQALQHRLVDCYLANRLAGAAVRRAASCESGERSLAVMRARERTCHAALTNVREAIQMHGAIGYTAEHDVALYAWRALVMTARFGGAVEEIGAAGAFAPTAPAAGPTGFAAAAGYAGSLANDTDWNALDDEHFRAEVRAWITAHYPSELRHLPYQVRWSEIRHWHARLLERGWAAPAWPPEHGGMGLSVSKLLIYIEEFECHGIARAPDQGIVMLGPILFEHGTAAQRERYLAKALSGEHIWCQGYSEPNAGSDLASLTTRAVLEGNEFVVTGQKTWTTHALDATHMYCLVRTEPDVKPQAGISFLLIDLAQSGVDIRPIPNLGGHVDFCEVFLDEVRVPAENLVGKINEGWTIAKALLGHERLFVGSPKLCQHALNQLRALAVRRGLFDDPVFVDAFVRGSLDVDDLEALYAEFADVTKAGQELGADVALLKIWSTETYAALSELIIKASGEAAARIGGSPDTGIDALAHYYNARPAPIYAGSNEIQRNIIAKHVLALPS